MMKIRSLESSQNTTAPEFAPWREQGSHIRKEWRQRIQESSAETFFLLDIDDTLVEGLALWYDHFAGVLSQREPYSSMSGTPEDRQRAAKNFLVQNGNAFEYLREELGREEFAKHEDLLKNSRTTYQGGDLTHPELLEIIESIASTHGEVLGGLTARISKRMVRMATRRALQRNGLLEELPVLYRPAEMDYLDALNWKPEEMLQLREVAPEKLFILIDDSASTAKAVGEKNRVALANGETATPLIQILLRSPFNGSDIVKKLELRSSQGAHLSPESLKDLDEGELPPGVFIAENWTQVSEKIRLAKLWVESLRQPAGAR